MARGLADAITATFSSSRETLERCTLLHKNGFDFEFVDVRTVVVFCIRNGRLQNFLDDDSRLFGGELQNI